MKFRKLKGYKYILEADERFTLKVNLPSSFWTEWVCPVRNYFYYSADGTLSIRAGYAWDGASGPTIDTKTTYHGSLLHDLLYQLMREGIIPRSYRKAADQELRDVCIEHGMYPIRAKLWYLAVRTFGGKQALPRKNPRGQIIDTEAL